MYRYTLYRDSIELNKRLNDLIKQELGKDNSTSYPGRTVLFAARKIQIDKGFTFELSNCDLILVADEFDTFEGTIKISVAGSSAIGQPGLPGRKITVLCKEIAGINVDLKGGTGGPGATGLRGEDGDTGLDELGQVDGKNGGKGKKGGQGGAGGKGGELSIRFLRDKIPGGIRHLTTI